MSEEQNINMVDFMNRPWGSWWVLEKGEGYKVKRLQILPNESISLQYHNERDEVWTVVSGEGRVVIEGRIFNIRATDTFFVPKKNIHKVTCTSKEPLVAIEVQIGAITNESDIVRV